MTKCTSINCVYRNECARQIYSNSDDDEEDSYYNFEYGGCTENWFSDYIKGDENNQ